MFRYPDGNKRIERRFRKTELVKVSMSNNKLKIIYLPLTLYTLPLKAPIHVR